MDYNKKSYRLILESTINRGYEFVDFLTLRVNKSTKQVILRHDIDYSLAMAREMAAIDASHKIKSTFALQLSSPFYNPFTPASIKTINEIQMLGHNLVLHHRVVSGQAGGDIQKDVISAMRVMREFFPYIKPVFVWHNLPPNNLLGDINVPGMVNAYSPSFVRNMLYISDSVLRHSPDDFLHALDKHDTIHMLLHPIIWMSEKDTMVSMINYAFREAIRECARESILNPAWEKVFPHGISGESLNKIAELLEENKDKK